MNVLFKYTRRSLLQNKSRTLVTVVGILLSMALFTAVIEGAYSGLQFLIRGEIDMNGAYHGVIWDLPEDKLTTLTENGELADWNLWRQVGWAEIGSTNEYKPYLLIQDISEGSSLAAVHLKSGRLPENETELLLPEHLLYNGEVDAAVGDTLTLSVGRRTVSGLSAGQNDAFSPGQDALTDTQERRYRVVGIYERLSSDIEPYETAGYTALTFGGGSGSYTVLFTLDRPQNAYSVFQQLKGLGSGVQPHQYLLAFYGSIRGGSLSGVLYGLAAILVLLIGFGSISLIYNSFSISVSERTRQFGILKSIGATRKQIRGAVLYEALLLSAVAIPGGLLLGCVGIGLVLYLLRDGFQMLIGRESQVTMQLVLNPIALGIASLICLLTTLISAWIPARRATRVSPLEAIRQSADVKLTGRDVSRSKRHGNLFGFAGTMAAKNFRRNRKRYRATVISLFLSVVLFIAASSFCAYLTDVVNTSLSDGAVEYELWWGNAAPTGAEEAERCFDRLMQTEYVTAGTYYASLGSEVRFDAAALSEAALDSSSVSVEGSRAELDTTILFLRDDTFRGLCEENGLQAEDYLRPEQPRALLKNDVETRYYSEDGIHFESFALLKPAVLQDSAPITAVCEQTRYEIDGLQLMEEEGGRYYYYPEAYLSAYWRGEAGDALDRSQATVLTKSEAVLTQELSIGAILRTTPYYLTGDSRPTLIYPYSLMERTLSPMMRSYASAHYVFRSDDHAVSFTQMRNALDDMSLPSARLYDYAEESQSMRMIVTIVNVFSYGFILLISLIAAANVFNTVSTGISLRRRELAMLESVGLGKRDFYRMMNYECLIYGSRALLWGLPVAFLVTYGIYRVVGGAFDRGFYVPWYSILISVSSVFAVVFASMLYAARKLRRQNLIDALKQETL